MSRPQILISLLVGAVLVVAGAPAAALADSSTSTNWSGYAAHRSGVDFRRVSAMWTQPSAACTPGVPTYSAVWVGLGGYNLSSNALEQIGTEVDCTASGQVASSAWYELVPAPSAGIRMTVKPGDVMAATVIVVGHRVTLSLTDRTRHKSFSRTVDESTVDVTSAEWIVEAPSECFTSYQCRALPLADFGSVHFAAASAQTTAGHTGSVSSRYWGTTKITLAASGRTYISYGAVAEATPSPLRTAGSSFDVGYSQLTVNPSQPAFRANVANVANVGSAARASGAVQPGGARR